MYKVIEIVTVNQLAEDMGAAEREGYIYVGAVENPGDSIVIMHKQQGEEREHLGWRNLPLDEWAAIASLLREATITDGAHHKQWYLEQLAEKLRVSLPDHEEGIAP